MRRGIVFMCIGLGVMWALLAIAIAEASANVPSDRALRAAFNIAERHWGKPVCSPLEVRFEPLEDRTRAYTYIGGDPCRIVYANNVRWRWPELCVTTAHEVGHLHGRRHSKWPYHLMAPVMFDWSFAATERTPCGLRPPYARRKPRNRDRT